MRESVINSSKIVFSIMEMAKEEYKRLEDVIEKENILVKSKLAISIIEDNKIKKKLKERQNKIDEIKKTESQNEKLSAEIKQLLDSKSDISGFAEYLNNTLKELELKFQLAIEDETYVLKHIDENVELTVHDISEGELNLLALLFFYNELFDDEKHSKIKDEIKLIIIDDPISSVDNYNRFYIISLIQNIEEIIKQSKYNKQVFLFTHVWEDFCELNYNRDLKNDLNRKSFNIIKESSSSRIERIIKVESVYKHLFKEIKTASEKSVLVDECDLYHLPNTIRKVLEEYLKFKSPTHNPTSTNYNNICRVLCGNNPSDNQKTKVHQLISVCNTYSHELNKADEVLSSAKFFIECIKKIDPNHYEAMTSQ